MHETLLYFEQQVAVFSVACKNLEQNLGKMITALLEQFDASLPKRKNLPDSTKCLHCKVTLNKRNGLCSCCQETRIVGGDGQLELGAEFDHWYSRDRNGPEETWLVCRLCNDRLREPSFKNSKTSVFKAYQQAVRLELDRETLPLFQSQMAA